MRKVISTRDLDWEATDALKSILDLQYLPRFIIIETVEESD
jgi:hypothetical protein